MPQVDYAALAEQARKAPVDYAALAAQARGDFDVLTERGRRALRLHIKGDVAKGLATINSAIGKALT